MNTPRTVLTIAGSDSGGGAGIQADIKTISAMGCYATSAITAITVQNTLGVQAVHLVPPDIVRKQIEAVLSDIGADAVKTGMLGSAEVVREVGIALRNHRVQTLVLDPLMYSTSGHPLTDQNAIDAICTHLIPLATLITPNIPEAETLLDGTKLTAQSDLPEAARQLASKYGVSVLIKAGHLPNPTLTDYLYDITARETVPLPSQRVDTRNTHGTGCTLASAIAAALAKGETLTHAVQSAKKYLAAAINAGAELNIGHGHGPVCHFYELCK